MAGIEVEAVDPGQDEDIGAPEIQAGVAVHVRQNGLNVQEIAEAEIRYVDHVAGEVEVHHLVDADAGGGDDGVVAGPGEDAVRPAGEGEDVVAPVAEEPKGFLGWLDRTLEKI